jgi:hypothetical protein
MGLNVNFVDLADTTSFFSGNYDATSVFVTICCALAIYNAIELLLLIFTTFRRFHGLYFWSLLVASVGIVPYVLGFMIEFYELTAQLAGLLITFVGWPMMVTGQSLVLYSRLHVVLGEGNQRILKAVRWMIIINGIVLTIATEGMLCIDTVCRCKLTYSHSCRRWRLLCSTPATLRRGIQVY